MMAFLRGPGPQMTPQDERRWSSPGGWLAMLGLILLGGFGERSAGQTYEIRRLSPPPSTFLAGESAFLSPLVVNNRGEILIDNLAENATSTRQKGVVMARWSVGSGSTLSYRRLVASVPKHASDLTWQRSSLWLVDLADDGTAVGYETYEGLENATFENAGAKRIQELGLFHDLVVVGPDATVPRRLGVHTYVRQLWNNVIRTAPVTIAVNGRGSILGRYRIYHRFEGTEFGGDFVLNPPGKPGYLPGAPRGGAIDFNDRDEVIGVLPGGVAGIWNPGFKPLPDVMGYAGGGRLSPAKINLHGEIAGQIFEPGNVSKLFLWLPRASYGLGAGLHTLFTVTNTTLQVFDLNDSGALLWTYGTAPNNNAYLWTERRSVPLRQAVGPNSPLFPVRSGTMSLNDLGWITGWAVGSSGGEAVPMVMRPLADAEALLSTNRVRVGEVFTFVLRLGNHSGTAATLGLPIGFRLSGSARFELVGNPSPPGPRVVPAYGAFEIRQQIRALSPGSARWFSQGRMISGGSTNDTLHAYAESIRVLDRADLLIKRGSESEDRYGINNEYQAVPAGAQVRTLAVRAGEMAEFHLRVENDDNRSRTFRVRAEESGQAGEWQIQHLLGAEDVSPSMRSPSGFQLPPLAPGAFHQVILRIRGTNAVPGDRLRTFYTLEDATLPGDTADAVEAVTEMSGEILVNSTGDESDADPYDGVADVDLNKPGAQTTLRAAIEWANQRAGRDRIMFGIPPLGNVFEGGVPVLRPAKGLPRLTEAAVVDGWTQAPDSATPPVVLNGSRIPLAGDLPAERQSWDSWLENPAAAHGLELGASESRVTGLVIQQFPLFGIRFEGDGHVIEGNFIGTDATGSFARANGILASLDTGMERRLVGGGISGTGSRNRIGGVGPRSGNLIAGLSDGYLAFPGADLLLSGPSVELFGDENEVLGNWVGVDRTGDALIGGLDASKHQMIAGILLSGNMNRVGGSAVGEGNVILGVRSSGISLLGDLNRIQGNHVGLGDSGRSLPRKASEDPRVLAGGRVGIRVEGTANEIGGAEPGAGNRIGNALTGVSVGGMLGGLRTLVAGNRVGLEVGDVVGAPLELAGLRLLAVMDAVVRSNTVAHVTQGNGVEILRLDTFEPGRTRVERNRVFSVGLELSSSSVGLGAGILVGAGQGHRLEENQIQETASRAIILYDASEPREWTNDEGDADEGPNRMQNHPVITRAVSTTRGGNPVTEIEGVLRTARGSVLGESVPYVVEVFYGDRAGVDGSGEAAALMNAWIAPINPLGEFALKWASSRPVAEPGQWVAATATDPAGNTSMLSPAVMVQGDTDADADAMSDAVEDRVPGLSGSAGRALAGLAVVPTGDGNGDGVADSRQAEVVSFPSWIGPWITVASSAGTRLIDARPALPPAGGQGPVGVDFPSGWFEVGIQGGAVGATVELTLIVHGLGDLQEVYAAEAAPSGHLRQAILGRSLSEERKLRVTVRDGGEGDLDGAANGIVRLWLGMARRLPDGPVLQIVDARRVVVERPAWSGAGDVGQSLIQTVPGVQSILNWPAHATNWWPEQSVSIDGRSGWTRVVGERFVRGEHSVITNLGMDPNRFFRMRRVR